MIGRGRACQAYLCMAGAVAVTPHTTSQNGTASCLPDRVCGPRAVMTAASAAFAADRSAPLASLPLRGSQGVAAGRLIGPAVQRVLNGHGLQQAQQAQQACRVAVEPRGVTRCGWAGQGIAGHSRVGAATAGWHAPVPWPCSPSTRPALTPLERPRGSRTSRPSPWSCAQRRGRCCTGCVCAGPAATQGEAEPGESGETRGRGNEQAQPAARLGSEDSAHTPSRLQATNNWSCVGGVIAFEGPIAKPSLGTFRLLGKIWKRIKSFQIPDERG